MKSLAEKDGQKLQLSLKNISKLVKISELMRYTCICTFIFIFSVKK
jgi:hypothetical protein